MKADTAANVHRVFYEDRRVIDEALKQGVREALLRHKKDGLPVVIYRDAASMPVWSSGDRADGSSSTASRT